MTTTRFFTILGLIFLGMVSRFLPHPPNFTAINAIALFSVCSLGSLGTSFLMVFSTMLLSDLIFGFHSSILFVYLSLAVTVLMGHWLNAKKLLLWIVFLLVISSLIFFLITNFGVWMVSPLYPKTVAGLNLCYVAALPFLLNTVASTLLYGGILFGWFALAERCIPAVTVRS